MRRFIAASTLSNLSLIALLSSVSSIALLTRASLAEATTIDPARADQDIDTLRKDGADGFCTDPPKPLSPRGEELCALSHEIARCDGLINRCEHPEPIAKPSDWGILKVLGPIAQVLVWVLLAALLIALAIPIARAIAKVQRDKRAKDEPLLVPPRPSAPPPPPDVIEETDVDRLLRRAEELKARGDHAHAQYAYLRASLLSLDEKGAIRLAPHRTHGEYVRSLRDPEAKTALREIVREVDQVKFGGRPASEAVTERVAARALAIVRMVPLSLLLLLAMTLAAAGCGSHLGRLRASDPAGDELLLGLLPAQGFTLSHQRGPLSSLPLPLTAPNTKNGEPSPAVIVDLESVSLDDETSAHLMRWVEAGGVLMLVGDAWPKEIGAKARAATTTKLEVPHVDLDLLDETDLESWNGEEPLAPGVSMHGNVVHPTAISWKDSTPLANLGGATFAAMKLVGKGRIVLLSNDDLFTNAALSRPGNPGALVAILWHLHRTELRIARPEEGSSPPSGPFAALSRAGLGLGLVHALVATAILFLAVGVRLVRATPKPPPVRRAFTEHVVATGALYARTRSSPHALACYARWVDERVRARMPRGTTDPAAWLAQRSKTDEAEAQRIWNAATAEKTDQAAAGNELLLLKQLGALYVAALDDVPERRR